MKHKFLLLYTWFVYVFLFFFPDVPLIMRFRGWLYGLGMNSCGSDFQVTHSALLNSLEYFEIGRHVYIGNNTSVLAHGIIKLEDEVLIGSNCILVAGDHSCVNASYRFGKCIIGDIKIERGSWIAGNCTVIKGSVLPEGSILGANSMLNKAFDSKQSLYAGSPAIKIKRL